MTLKNKGIKNGVNNGLGIKMLMHIIGFWVFLIFYDVCIGGENIVHLV
jgi:hypothetical protein